MADNRPQSNSDEIDLGQLFQLIGNGFKKISVAILRAFLYLKKNMLILIGLLILGLAIGYGLSKVMTKKIKTEVIVKPNMESKDYLYYVVGEIRANLKAKNLAFFKKIGVTLVDVNGLEIEIDKIGEEKSSEEEIKYLELLQNFEKNADVSDIVRKELQNKSTFNHKITFVYKDIAKGEEFAAKVMQYINDNDYFNELAKIYRENAQNRIEENKALLKQVDGIITGYSKKMGQNGPQEASGRIVLDNKESLNVTGLFNYKNNLIKDIEEKNIELKEQKDAISIINFGKPQQVQKSFFGKISVMVPFLLLGIFFLVSFLGYLNKKASEIA